MNLTGLDLNATRTLAVAGPVGAPPRPLPLDGVRPELPMALSLQNRHPDVGRAGTALCRLLPHLSCLNFLPHLGHARTWSAGRHRLDADKALGLVFDRLRKPLTNVQGVALALPAYLSPEQVDLVLRHAEKFKVPVLGSVSAPLALTLAAYGEQPWTGLAVVVDADDHEMSAVAVTVGADQAQVVGGRTLPRLGLQAWLSRLIDAVADRCVRHSRRDPRDSAPSEQMLYEQIDASLDACRFGQPVELKIEAPHWYQNVLLTPEEMAGFCAGLSRQVAEAVRSLVGSLPGGEPACVVLMSHAAARLPGLIGLLDEGGDADAPVHALQADAAATSAHALAERFSRGEIVRGHLAATVPLATPGRLPNASVPVRRVSPILYTGY